MSTYCKLNPLALGLAIGILWGVSILLMGLLAYFFAYGEGFVVAMGTLYYGYSPTLMGSFIGGLIGLIDGFICGVIIGWLYNLLGGCRNCFNKDKDI